MACAYEELALSNPHSIAQPGGSAFAHQDASARVPHEALGKLFLRFLKFGFFAWGGAAAQIATIRQKLVTEEKWVTPQHFIECFRTIDHLRHVGYLGGKPAGAVILTVLCIARLRTARS